MRVRYSTANGRLTFEFESENDKTLVTHLAHIQEVFEEQACGCCKSDKIRFDVREFDGNFYYKLLCDACGGTLDFGQHRTGNTLFVKRFEKDTRNPLPNGGWYRYKEQGQTGPSSVPPTKAASVPSTNRMTKPEPPPSRPTAATQTDSKPKAVPPTEAHVQTLAALRVAEDASNADAWVAWGATQPRTVAQKREQEAAHRAALESIAQRQSPAAKPTLAAVKATPAR